MKAQLLLVICVKNICCSYSDLISVIMVSSSGLFWLVIQWPHYHQTKKWSLTPLAAATKNACGKNSKIYSIFFYKMKIGNEDMCNSFILLILWIIKFIWHLRMPIVSGIFKIHVGKAARFNPLWNIYWVPAMPLSQC